MPGYRIAPGKLRIFGEGLVHGSPVSSNHIPRCQFSTWITVRSALQLRSTLHIRASSPIVIPYRHGTSEYATKLPLPTRTGPLIIVPVIGFTRSSTKYFFPFSPAAARVRPVVAVYV